MNYTLSKHGVIDASMAGKLRTALHASDAFDFPDPMKIEDLEGTHLVHRKNSSHLQSLSARLVKSESPFLVILQNLCIRTGADHRKPHAS